MKNYSLWLTCLILVVGVTGCRSKEPLNHEATERLEPAKDTYLIPVKELSDEEYPDNPDIGHRSSTYFQYSHPHLRLTKNEDSTYRFSFLPGNEMSDTLVMPSVDLDIYMLALPDHILKDAFLTKVGIVNQEWNRQQIRYDDDLGYWELSGDGTEKSPLVRVDLARNCLNAGLWELILFEADSLGNTVPYYHGWFDFPEPLYAQIFEEHSGLKWKDYRDRLVTFKPIEVEPIAWETIRTVVADRPVEVESLNDQYYPETGARAKKKKNIMVPSEFTVIQDFLSDSTLFGTFSPPGFYNTQDPRKTKLGELASFKAGKIREVQINAKEPKGLLEVALQFDNPEEDQVARIVFGGLDPQKIPTLSLKDHNKGLKMPMGIANHAFYETYAVAKENPVKENSYYALVEDNEGKWTDSHDLGIDGPLLFWDEQQPDHLHVMVLSFERHCFVGHYLFKPL